MKPAKPAPVVVSTICSLCDQPWEAHGPEPTSVDCIRLLKAALRSRPTFVPAYPVPVPSYPVYPYWTTSYRIDCSTTTGKNPVANINNAVEYRTPAITATCEAVA